MSHSMRADIFKVLTEGPASPSQIMRRLDLSRRDLSNIDYHVKFLVTHGCAEELGRRKLEGKRPERVYQATERSIIETGEWEDLLREHPALADHLLGEFMQAQLDDYVAAVRAGTVGGDDHFHMTRTRRVLDRQGLLEGLERYEDFRREMDEVERRAAERRREDGEDAIHVSSGFALFEVPAPATE